MRKDGYYKGLLPKTQSVATEHSMDEECSGGCDLVDLQACNKGSLKQTCVSSKSNSDVSTTDNINTVSNSNSSTITSSTRAVREISKSNKTTIATVSETVSATPQGKMCDNETTEALNSVSSPSPNSSVNNNNNECSVADNVKDVNGILSVGCSINDSLHFLDEEGIKFADDDSSDEDNDDSHDIEAFVDDSCFSLGRLVPGESHRGSCGYRLSGYDF